MGRSKDKARAKGEAAPKNRKVGRSTVAAKKKPGPAKGTAKTPGRPTKYREEYAELAEKFCMLGATNERLAEFFDVQERTINYWLTKHDEFLQAVKRGRAEADATVAQSLFKRACGYEHPEDKIFLHEGEPVIVPTVKHYPPDSTAAIFWLKNRQREHWKDYKAVEVANATDEDGNERPLLVDFRTLPYDEAREQRKPPPGKGV